MVGIKDAGPPPPQATSLVVEDGGGPRTQTPASAGARDHLKVATETGRNSPTMSMTAPASPTPAVWK